MRAIVVLAAGLALPGVPPALAAAGWSAMIVFLAPVTGAVMAAVAAEIELGLGGSLQPDYAGVAAAVNVAVIAWWAGTRRAAGRRSVPPPRTRGARAWSVLAVPVVVGCLAVPLSALRGPMFAGDGNSIWATHALMVYGGHHELLTSLRNVAYQFSNPDYPPLVPAAGALAFKFYGLGNLHLAVDMTVLVTACGLGVVAMGLVAVSDVAAAGSGAAGPPASPRSPPLAPSAWRASPCPATSRSKATPTWCGRRSRSARSSGAWCCREARGHWPWPGPAPPRPA